MAPDPTNRPHGLPDPDRIALKGLAGWRRRLYWTFARTCLVAAAGLLLFAVFLPTDGIEPALPSVLSSIVAMVLTGLPVVVLDFIEKYPVLTLGVFLLILLIRVASRRVKEQAQEYAFQAWRRTGNSARPASPPAQPTRWVRIATAVLEPVSAVVLIGCVGLVGLIVSWPPPTQAAGAANDRAACADTRGDCRLAPGESMLVTLRADQPRNETGLMLEQGETYTARFIANVGWRDASKEPTPEGFASFERRLGIPRFIWTRWRRPLPEGRWFEVVGRIDREPGTFSILEADDARRPHEFTAPETGELVLLVNDVNFDNNGGVMTVHISRP